MIKKLLLLATLIALAAFGFSQTTIVRARAIVATENLAPPSDTLISPKYLGEMRYKASNNTIYYAKALTGSSKWSTSYATATIQIVGGGNGIISPASGDTTLKFKSMIANTGISIYSTDTSLQFSIDVVDVQYTSGSSGTISPGHYKYNVVLNPASTLSTFTLNLPASPSLGTEVSLQCGGTITTGTVVTSFSLSGNGTTIIGTAPTTLVVGTKYIFRYNANSNFWY